MGGVSATRQNAASGIGASNLCGSPVLLLGFVNTGPHAAEQEQLGDAKRLAAWMAEFGLMESGDVVTQADVVAARELRDALITVLRAHSGCIEGAALLPDAEVYLQRTAERYPLTLKITAEGCTWTPAQSGILGAFAGLLAAAADLAASGAWPRMKICGNRTCFEAFVDKTRNSAGLYCSTACGSQASQRAYRNRLKDAGARAKQ